jgi:hypothetical protein
MFLGADVDKLRKMAEKLQKFAAKLDTVRKILEIIVFASIFFGPFGGAIRSVLKIVIKGLKYISIASRSAASVLNGNILQQIGASAAGAAIAPYVSPVVPPESTAKIIDRVIEGIKGNGSYKQIAGDIFGETLPDLKLGNTGISIGANGINLPLPVGNGNPAGVFGTPPINGAAVPTGSLTIGPNGIVFNGPKAPAGPTTNGTGVIPGVTPGTTQPTFPTETFKGAQPILGTGPVLDQKTENARHLVISGGSLVPPTPNITTKSSIDPKR